MLKTILSVILFIGFWLHLKGQNTSIDSIQQALQKAKTSEKSNLCLLLSKNYIDLDSIEPALRYAKLAYQESKDSKIKLDAIVNLGMCFFKTQFFDSAKHYLYLALEKNKKADYLKPKDLKVLHATIALLFENESDFYNAINSYNLAYDYAQLDKDTAHMSRVLINIGYLYSDLGNQSEAIDKFLHALDLALIVKDTSMIARTNMAIGYSTFFIKDYRKALSYYFKALNYANMAKNDLGISICYINIGSAYEMLLNIDSALYYYKKALIIQEEKVKDPMSVASIYSNIGLLYQTKGQNETALNYLNKAKSLARKYMDYYRMAVTYNDLGGFYLNNSNYKQAKHYADSALFLADTYQFLEIKRASLKLLFKYYYKSKDFANAVAYLSQYHDLKDSINSMESKKQIANLETKFELNSKNREIELLKEKESIQQTKLQQHKQIIYLSMALVILFIIFLILVMRMLRNKNRSNALLINRNVIIQEQNEELKQQKEEIIAQKEEIIKQNQTIQSYNIRLTNSLQYALRIQNAILPDYKSIKKVFPEHFLIYKPKDIVGGDFYWINQKDNECFFAVADCTGHGVPGAFITFILNNALHRAVNETKLVEPSEILNQINSEVIHLIEKSDKNHDLKIGMDIVLCKLNLETLRLNYSGSLGIFFLIHNHAIQEIKTDIFSIGLPFDDEFKSFKNNEIQLNTNDVLVLFSDGYADQMSEKTGRKYLRKQFKENILKYHTLSMSAQKEHLITALENWQGNAEQIDDITVLSVKISHTKQKNNEYN